MFSIIRGKLPGAKLSFAFPGQKAPRTLIPSLRRRGNGVVNNLKVFL
jgi:hypothetical protein